MSIKRKVTTVTISVMTISLIMSAVALFAIHFATYNEKAESILKSSADLIAFGIEPIIQFQEVDEATDIINSLVSQTDIDEVHIFVGYDKEPFATTNPGSEYIDKLPEKKTDFYTFDGDLWYVTELKSTRDIVFAKIVLKFSSETLAEEQRKSLYSILVVFLVLLIISYFISRFLQSKLSKPITAFENSIKSITEEGLKEQRVKKESEDEIGHLVDYVNIMLDSLETQSKEIELREKQYKLLAENSVDVICVRNENFKPFYVSPSVKKVLGWMQDEWLNMKPSEHLPKESEAMLTENFNKVLNQAKTKGIDNVTPIHLEIKQYHKNGSKIWTSITMTAYLGIEDKELSILCVTRNINEEKLIKEKIKEREEKFRTLFENGNDAILIIENNKFIEFNQRALEMFACEQEDIVGSNQVRFSPEYQPDGSLSKVVALEKIKFASEGKPQIFEWKYCRLDGSEFEAEVSFTRLLLKGKHLVQCIVRDISNRKEAEREILRNEEKFRNIFNSSTDGILVYNQDIKIIEINKTGLEIIGLSYQEVIGRNALDFIVEKHLFKVKERIALLKYNETLPPYEIELRNNNNTIIPIELTSKLIDYQGKRVSLTVFRDISEKKNAELEIARTESKFRNIFNSSADGFFIVSMDYTILEVNKSAENMLGYFGKDVIGTKIYEYIPEEYLEELDKGNRKLEQGATSVYYEIEATKGNGEKIPIEVFDQIIEYHGQKAFFTIIRDVSSRKIAEKERLDLESQLQQSQKMEAIGTLAAGISHDFNNILQTIVLSSDIAKLHSKNEKVSEKLEVISTAVEKATDLIKQILTYSRNGMESKSFESIDIIPLLKESVKLLSNTIPSSIGINFVDSSVNSIIECDPVQIQQVIINIGTNAWHAMVKKGGKFELEIENIEFEKDELGLAKGSYLLIKAKDNGHGMTDEVKKRIFEPFYTTKSPGKGTGLGLSVSFGIVRKHNGIIKVYSEEGKGTSFQVFLPLSKTVENVKIKKEAMASAGSESIMLIDDDNEIANLQKERFEILGYTVHIYSNPLEALKKFKEEPAKFEVIVTDYSMPNLMGTQFAREIRKIGQYGRNIPIILYSGLIDFIDIEELEELNIKFKISKPVNVPKLAQAIRKAIDENSKD